MMLLQACSSSMMLCCEKRRKLSRVSQLGWSQSLCVCCLVCSCSSVSWFRRVVKAGGTCLIASGQRWAPRRSITPRLYATCTSTLYMDRKPFLLMRSFMLFFFIIVIVLVFKSYFLFSFSLVFIKRLSTKIFSS